MAVCLSGHHNRYQVIVLLLYVQDAEQKWTRKVFLLFFSNRSEF